jgi:hypothetical protein
MTLEKHDVLLQNKQYGGQLTKPLYLFSDVKLNWAWIAIWLREGLASEVSSAEGAHDMIRCQVFALLIFLNEFVWSALVIRSCRR